MLHEHLLKCRMHPPARRCDWPVIPPMTRAQWLVFYLWMAVGVCTTAFVLLVILGSMP